MAALGTPGGVVSDEDHRQALAGLIAPQTSTLAVRTGVMVGPGSTALVTGTSATGTMTVAVAPFHVVTTRGTADGVYLGTLAAATTVNIAAAPGSNSRIDVVYAKQNDSGSTISPDGSTTFVVDKVTGTAAASPTKPALPVGATELATVQVAAGTTSTNGAGATITNTALQVSARGARIPVRNQAERDALTGYPGLEVYRLDSGMVEQYPVSGTTWLKDSADFPVAFAYQTAAQTGLGGGWITMTLGAKSIDTHSAVNGSGRFTVPAGQGGTYAVEGGVIYGAMPSAAQVIQSRIAKNGAAFAGCTGNPTSVTTAAAAGLGTVTGRKLLVLAAGDYLELQGANSGGTWSTTALASDAAPWLAVERVR